MDLRQIQNEAPRNGRLPRHGVRVQLERLQPGLGHQIQNPPPEPVEPHLVNRARVDGQLADIRDRVVQLLLARRVALHIVRVERLELRQVRCDQRDGWGRHALEAQVS